MRIVCPSCSAAYDVTDSLLTPGRTVRCSRCGEEWVARTVEAPMVNEPEPKPEPGPEPGEMSPEPPEEREPESPRLTAMDRLAQTAPPQSSGRAALRTAWVASIVVILALLWGAYAWRADVMADWPPSVRLYSLLGLAAPQH